MSEIVLTRLNEERKNWRRDPPVGFYARPSKKADNSADMMCWECGIPGPEGSDWEGGLYTLNMQFSNEYPVKPPHCKFNYGLFHPNIWSNGEICLSILKEGGDWRPGVSIKQILLAIQDMLINPNPFSPANGNAAAEFQRNKVAYSNRVKAEAKKHTPDT